MKSVNLYKGILNFNSRIKKNETNLQLELESIITECVGSLNFAHYRISKFNSKNGIPDGIIYLNNTKAAFELKYTLSSKYSYNSQLTQVLCYYLLDNSFKVLFLVSENYFDYLFIDENVEIIESFRNKYEKDLLTYSPRTIADNVYTNANQFNIHKNKLDEHFDLKSVLEKIIKHFE